MRKEFNYNYYKSTILTKSIALDVYKKLIEHSKSGSPNCYIEKHHIVPKCLNGTNEKENLVFLTYPEHIFAHYLLSIIHFPNLKLLRAFILMSNSNQDINNIKCESDILINFQSFENYQILKEANSKLQSKKHSKKHILYTVVVDNVRYTNLYKNNLEKFFKDLKLEKVIFKNKVVNTSTICYRPSCFANNKEIYLSTISNSKSYKKEKRKEVILNSNISKVNVFHKDEFYNKKVKSGRYKKYRVIINEVEYNFTRRELSDYFEENEFKAIQNLFTGRCYKNLKQFLNHIDRFTINDVIKINSI